MAEDNVPTNESEFYNPNTIDKDLVKTRNATFHNRTPIVDKTYPDDKFEEFADAIHGTNSREKRNAIANSRGTKTSKPQSINQPRKNPPKSGPQGATYRT